MVVWLADLLVCWCLDLLVCRQVGLVRLIGWALGQSSGVLLACLVDWLGMLVGRSVVESFGRSVDWCLLGWLVGGLVGCGSDVWSMGRLAFGSLVRLFGGTVGCCVGQLFCGQLEDRFVRFLVGLSVDCSFG